MKKQEEVPEGFVIVTRQIIKDNVYMGEEERIVWGEKAKEQLSLPNDERNPHWRNVKLKAISKKESADDKPDNEEESAGIEIPRKRSRNV